MKKIYLNGKHKDKFALVDDEDFERLNKLKWFIQTGDKTNYAIRNIPMVNYKRGGTMLMHREIMQTPKGMEIDHKDGNGLNNQKSNLRNCTGQQNAANKRIGIVNKSGYLGVSWDKERKLWRATTSFGDKQVWVGRYSDIIQAAKARDLKAKELFGEFAALNFP